MLQLKAPLSNDLRCVGIDVAKAKFDVQIDNGKKPFTVPNTPSGRSKLITRLEGLPLASIVVPHIPAEDVDELERMIEEGKQPASYEGVFDDLGEG